MPFRPHHCFANRARLEQLVDSLHGSGQVPDDISENFQRYHSSMIHKLKSAKYNMDRLNEKITNTSIQDAANPELGFEINMFIDGFFYNSGSALDILARVVLTLFGQPLPDHVYFQTAHSELSNARPGDLILPRLANPPWRQQFSKYRNTLTHELIIASQARILINLTGTTQSTPLVIPLPDNPRARPAERTFRRFPDVLEYVTLHFKRILIIANTVYSDIADRASANGSLPI